MKLKIFAVYDNGVNAYLRPFYGRSKGEAVRMFIEAANDKENNFHKFAADYILMELGEFDDVSGIFSGVEPRRVMGALEALSPQE
ncbi:nonstructural protein [Blackfly microvirus SF02]|uniref:Nonstructural protein n=1 Tax=Blackfly microvirus SF02 TaxID=2576452 RepID=A0A4P8PS80_9VIRU|nr:nonstructural protein [Blackfly microvirus SF02]